MEAFESLAVEFETFGLSGHEARALATLLRYGQVAGAEMARSLGISKTNVYVVMDSLLGKRLAERVASDGPRVWSPPPREDLMARLTAPLEERLLEQKKRAGLVDGLLVQLVPERPVLPTNTVHVIHGLSASRDCYNELLTKARQELLVFNRPPYALVAVNPVVIEAVQRGVKARALYEASDLESGQSAARFREVIEAYHAAGVEGRVVESLPVKLSVFDRRAALVLLDEEKDALPTTLRIEEPGYALAHAAIFENYWALSEPYQGTVDVSHAFGAVQQNLGNGDEHQELIGRRALPSGNLCDSSAGRGDSHKAIASAPLARLERRPVRNCAAPEPGRDHKGTDEWPSAARDAAQIKTSRFDEYQLNSTSNGEVP